MKKGWIQLSGIWYYLGTADGRMAVGWQSIGEKWYYLNPAEPVPVPATDPVTGTDGTEHGGTASLRSHVPEPEDSRRLHDRSRRSLDGIGNARRNRRQLWQTAGVHGNCIHGRRFLCHREVRPTTKNAPRGSPCGRRGFMPQSEPAAGGEARNRASFSVGNCGKKRSVETVMGRKGRRCRGLSSGLEKGNGPPMYRNGRICIPYY